MTFAIGFAKCRVCPKTILLTNTEWKITPRLSDTGYVVGWDIQWRLPEGGEWAPLGVPAASFTEATEIVTFTAAVNEVPAPDPA